MDDYFNIGSTGRIEIRNHLFGGFSLLRQFLFGRLMVCRAPGRIWPCKKPRR